MCVLCSNYDISAYFIRASSSKTYLDIFMICRSTIIVLALCHVTISQIIFSLDSSLHSVHPISEARVESHRRRRRCRRFSRHRRRSYRRGKLSETDSRSSRLRGSMLLPNSTEVGDRIRQ